MSLELRFSHVSVPSGFVSHVDSKPADRHHFKSFTPHMKSKIQVKLNPLKGGLHTCVDVFMTTIQSERSREEQVAPTASVFRFSTQSEALKQKHKPVPQQDLNTSLSSFRQPQHRSDGVRVYWTAPARTRTRTRTRPPAGETHQELAATTNTRTPRCLDLTDVPESAGVSLPPSGRILLLLLQEVQLPQTSSVRPRHLWLLLLCWTTRLLAGTL